jgi:hypothetical protein
LVEPHCVGIEIAIEGLFTSTVFVLLAITVVFQIVLMRGVLQYLSGSRCAAGAVTPTPTWVAGPIGVIARARRSYLIYGERN